MAVLDEQAEKSKPALTVIGLLMVSVLVAVALPQGALPIAVSVKVTLPAAISAALGIYVASVNELSSVKLPVPEEVQVILV